MSSSAFITYTTGWRVILGEGCKDEDGANPGWRMSRVEGSWIGPWLLVCGDMKDVEAYSPNKVEKGRVIVRREVVMGTIRS